MRSIRWVLVLSLVAGCKKGKAPDPKFEGPMPITFGACAAPKVAWVSGPKPLPFTPEEANRDWLAEAAPTPEDDPPPPPPDDQPDDDSGGTGTAMALDEGKMGKKDSDRAEGQYKMMKNDVDPQLARQQAIEQARAAGVLGSTSLVQGGAFASLTGTGTGFDDSNIYGGLLGNEAGEMNGGFGFGRSGFGPGGGGTGWGTIGTGRYGKIGHGSGTGTGYGVGGGRGGMRGSTASVPTVAIGQPAAMGDLDKAIIRRYIKRNIQKITYCYEKQLLANPSLKGTVQTQFFIAPSGLVASASASGVDPEVAGCVADVIKAIEFPKPKGGGGVQVNYPFTFRYAGDDSSPSSASAGSAGSAAGSAATPPPPPPPPAPAPAAAPPASSYDPGDKNPLRASPAELVDCLRKNPEHYGAAIVGLQYDASGAVTAATVTGITDEPTRACIVAVAKKVKRITPTAEESCSLAFGEMPVTALPGIDINGNEIRWQGKQITSTASVLADDKPYARDEKLYAAIEAFAHANKKPPGAGTVTIQGPLAVRADDATPMKVIYSVLRSITLASEDFVLAQASGTTWRTLPAVSLPVVPVPFGTGGWWNHVQSKSRDTGLIAPDDETVQLSVLVTKDKIWVGLSRVNEFQAIDRDASALQKLAGMLRDHKQSAFFADRDDAEVAAEDDVSYRDYLDVVTAVEKAGFTRYRITDATGLSARPQL